MFQVPIEVSDVDIISPYNHVHHAHALDFLERARLAYLEHSGYPLELFFKMGLFVVISELTVRYLREIRPSIITVTCENPRIDGKVFSLQQEILGPSGKRAVSATVEMMFLDPKRGQAVPAPADFVEALRAL